MIADATLALLGLALLLGLWCTRGRQRIARAALLVAATAALYLTLLPPTMTEPTVGASLIVVTPGATRVQRDALPRGGDRVRLPGAPRLANAVPVPDLATALRRFPEARDLWVVGLGLPARDRDAARGRVRRFEPAPLPRGLVELAAPQAVRAGEAWTVTGRVEGAPGGRVELADPAGAPVASASLSADGRFQLAALAKAAGPALFRLRILDPAGERVEDVPVPIAALPGAPLRVLLLAGAPDPELKYLRRWMQDAGLDLASRVALSAGIDLREGAAPLDAAALAQVDLAIIDARAWSALAADARARVEAAVRGGMGLLLRLRGAAGDAAVERAVDDWATLGVPLQADKPGSPAPLVGQPLAADIPLTRLPWTVHAADVAPLLRMADGGTAAWLRGRGQGRVGVWLLADSERLQLAGSPAAFGSLWSGVFQAIARPRGRPLPELSPDPRRDERVRMCALAADASVRTANGAAESLTPDAAGCAGWWPRSAGWHVLSSAGEDVPVWVRDHGEAAALGHAEQQAATAELVSGGGPVKLAGTRIWPWPRWPFFLAFLAAVGVLWWLERGVREHRVNT